MLDGRPLLMLALCFASCVMRAPAREPGGGSRKDARSAADPFLQDSAGGVSEGAGNVVLVTIDGVRWQEIFTGADPLLADAAALARDDRRLPRGMTPNLHRLFFDEGTVLGDPRVGEPFNASGPTFVSLPGYVEIMTGAISGCPGNECDPHVSWATIPGSESIPARRRSRPPRSSPRGSASRAPCPTDAAAASSSTPDAAQVRAKRLHTPAPGEYLPDRRAAAPWRSITSSGTAPRFLWVALQGDTDEWAHRGDYRGYVEALRFADDFVETSWPRTSPRWATTARTPRSSSPPIMAATASFADHGRPRLERACGSWRAAAPSPTARRDPAHPRAPPARP